MASTVLQKKRAQLNMTDEEWQDVFKYLKCRVQPSKYKRMKTDHPIFVNGYRDNTYFEYCGETQWQHYCQFINDVLRTIRKGEIDFCYHIYQIEDLLRFEHDRLIATWNQECQCFFVYLLFD